MAASTISRTTWTDDDGSGTTGTIINNARLQADVYDKIDAMFSGAGSYATLELGGNLKVDGNITGTVVNQLQQSFRGLALRTHPDSDKAANKVQVQALADVIMSSGVRYSGLTAAQITGLVADITASGAGGLDTGSRAASAWYGVYLIGKGDANNANLALMLHREKNYGLDQSQTTQDGSLNLRSASNSQVKIAQSFKPGVTGLHEIVDLLLRYNTTAPTGNFWVTLEADSAGAPSGTPLATSDKMDASKMGPATQWTRFVFRNPATLTSGTTYWIVLQGDYAFDGSTSLKWYDKSTTNPYANGTEAIYNGTTWSNTANADLAFTTYVTQNSAAPTLPTTYTEYCQLGWVYNNSGNAFDGFIARDKFVRLAALNGQAISTASPSISLTDYSATIPPVPVVAGIYAFSNSAGNSSYVGPVPGGFFPSTTMANMGLTAEVSSGDTARYTQSLGELPTEFQALYLAVGVGTVTFGIGSYKW